MIVTEHRLRDLFTLIPEIRINENVSLKPFFGWGNKKELDRTLEEYKSSVYPLIWLLPTEDNYDFKRRVTRKKCVLIVATLEKNIDRLNPTRYERNFDVVLNPLTSYIIESLRKSSITELKSNEVSIFKEPNYSESEGTIDLWDAVRLEFDLEINNNCLKPIKWRSVSTS